MIHKPSLLAGAGAAIAVRALLPRLALLKLRSDVRRLNAGDYQPLLAGYADDAVLHFNEGPHRWSGDYRGKPEIERFLREFTAAGLKGEIRELWIAGPAVGADSDRAFRRPSDRPGRRGAVRQSRHDRRSNPLGQDRRARGLLRGHRADPGLRPKAPRARHRPGHQRRRCGRRVLAQTLGHVDALEAVGYVTAVFLVPEPRVQPYVLDHHDIRVQP